MIWVEFTRANVCREWGVLEKQNTAQEENQDELGDSGGQGADLAGPSRSGWCLYLIPRRQLNLGNNK